MRVRRSVRAIALPVTLIMVTGAGLASVPVSASAAARARRPGKAVLKQPGAAPSSVASVSPGVVWAVGTQEIPAQCCLRTLALHTPAG